LRAHARFILAGLAVFALSAGSAALHGTAGVTAPGRDGAPARLRHESPSGAQTADDAAPRFFSPAKWTALPRRWDGASPEARRWFDLARARAAEVAAEPAPVRPRSTS